VKNKTLGIFISYARSDGKNFADDLRHRLIDEYRFQVWQDIVELEGGKDWWLQIEAAIKGVEFLVMVMTPGALASQTTRKEWRPRLSLQKNKRKIGGRHVRAAGDGRGD
jgi:hypothetical protein